MKTREFFFSLFFVIRLKPAYQHYVWGGERIPAYFLRDLPKARYAESWEVSDRLEGMSFVDSGPCKGLSLQEWVLQEKHKNPRWPLQWNSFPLLVKIIDSKERLSVQVHPDEQIAKQLGGEAKSESWIALEKSSVYVGLQSGVTKEDVIRAKGSLSFESLLRKIVLEKGEAIYIPAGEIHAICEDAFLLEVQQNSNTTYRIYDWERVGRELHLEMAMKAIRWSSKSIEKTIPSLLSTSKHHRVDLLLNTPYFQVQNIDVIDRYVVSLNGYHILFCKEGQGLIGEESYFPGATYLITEEISFLSIEGASRWVCITLPTL